MFAIVLNLSSSRRLRFKTIVLIVYQNDMLVLKLSPKNKIFVIHDIVPIKNKRVKHAFKKKESVDLNLRLNC